jgi:hypothetical protein
MDKVLVVLKVLDFAVSLVEAGSAAYAVLVQRRAEVRKLVGEGRDPTPAEWEALFTAIDQRTRHVLQRR